MSIGGYGVVATHLIVNQASWVQFPLTPHSELFVTNQANAESMAVRVGCQAQGN